MAHVPGCAVRLYTLRPDDPAVPKRSVSDFYLDPTEVTYGQLRAAGLTWIAGPGQDQHAPDEAVANLDFDRALALVEMLGKRLPDEAEFLAAATGGNTHRYPWGDDARPLHRPNWPLGPVGVAEYDVTTTDTPIRGLYSNLGEWTTTWLDNGRGMPTSIVPQGEEARVVFGVPLSVLNGRPDPREFAAGPYGARILRSRGTVFPTLGARGAAERTAPFPRRLTSALSKRPGRDSASGLLHDVVRPPRPRFRDSGAATRHPPSTVESIGKPPYPLKSTWNVQSDVCTIRYFEKLPSIAPGTFG